MTRTGLAPKFLIPFRSDKPFRKLSSQTYTDGKNDHKVEILGDGQQWVAYHVHPDTMRPYEWWDGVGAEGLVSIERVELPVLNRPDAQRVIDAFEVLAARMVDLGRWTAKVAPTATKCYRPCRSDDFARSHRTCKRFVSRANQIAWLITKLDLDSRERGCRRNASCTTSLWGPKKVSICGKCGALTADKYDAENQARVLGFVRATRRRAGNCSQPD